MNIYLAAVREIEASQSWKVEREKISALLRRSWKLSDWLCLLSCLDFLGDLSELRRELRTVAPSVSQSPPEAFALRMYMSGRLHQSLGEYGEALKWYMRAAAAYPSEDTSALLSLRTGTITRLAGNGTEARLFMERTLQKATSSGDLHSAAHAADFLVALAISSDEVPEARRWLNLGRDLASRASNSYRSAWLSFSEGELLWAEGEREHGLRLMRQVSSGFARVGALTSEIHALSRLSEYLQTIEEWEESAVVLRRAEKLASDLHCNVARGRILSGLAVLARLDGHDKEAASLEDRAHFIGERARRAVDEQRSGNLFSDHEILEFLERLTPDDFEVLCLRILEESGMQCSRTPVNFPDFDIEAYQSLQVSATLEERIVWMVSCKRYFRRNVDKNDLPNLPAFPQPADRTVESIGFIIMTTRRLSEPASAHLRGYPNFGVRCQVWNGDRIVAYLAANERVLSTVFSTSSTDIPSGPSGAPEAS